MAVLSRPSRPLLSLSFEVTLESDLANGPNNAESLAC